MRMMTAAIGIVAGMSLLALGACARVGSDTGDALDRTAWVLSSYGTTSPLLGTSITARFEDGQVRGSAGCNTYFGSYQVSGDKIKVGEVAMTEMACLEPEGAMEQEQVFAEYMRDARTFRISAGQLQLLRSDGEALTFDPQE